MIRLLDVYGSSGEPSEDAVALLYQLLAERPSIANISHDGKLPNLDRHRNFVRSRPYRSWMVVADVAFRPMGSVYATQANEIGVAILKEHHRCGFAERAIRALMKQLEPLPAISGVRRGAYVAHVAPGNYQSKALFEKLGGRVVQLTYELPRGE